MALYFLIAYLLIHSYILNEFDHSYIRIHTLYVLFLLLKLKLQKQNKWYIINSQKTSRLNICKICQQIKPPRFHHCRRCNRCIYRMDHHCIWIDNCIGQFNGKVYIHFLANFSFQFLLTICAALSKFDRIISQQGNQAYLLIIAIPSLYGFNYCLHLLREFYFSIKQNQTLVQSYQRVWGRPQQIQITLKEIMGQQFSLNWLIPTLSGVKNCNLRQPVKRTQVSKDDKIYADDYIQGSDEDFDQIDIQNHQSKSN